MTVSHYTDILRTRSEACFHAALERTSERNIGSALTVAGCIGRWASHLVKDEFGREVLAAPPTPESPHVLSAETLVTRVLEGNSKCFVK